MILTEQEKELIENPFDEFIHRNVEFDSKGHSKLKSAHGLAKLLMRFYREVIRIEVAEREKEIKAIATCEEIQGCDYVVIPLAKWQALKGGKDKKSEVWNGKAGSGIEFKAEIKSIASTLPKHENMRVREKLEKIVKKYE